MTSRSLASRVVFIACAGAFGVGLGLATAPRAVPTSVGPLALRDSAGASTKAPASVALNSLTSKTQSLAPTPNIDVPLADAYAALAERADAGDLAASQRLVSGLGECRGLSELETNARETELRLRAERRRDRSEAGVSESVNGWERLYNSESDKIVSGRRACEGLGTDRLDAYGHWLYRSAQLGDAKAALRFGEGGWLVPDDINLIADDAEVDFWRQHALEMMQRALAQGELRAALELAVSYGDIPAFTVFPSEGRSLYLYVALPPNGVQSLAYLHVAAETGTCETCEGDIGYLEYEIGPEGAAAARAEADRICAADLVGRCKAPTAPDDGTRNR